MKTTIRFGFLASHCRCLPAAFLVLIVGAACLGQELPGVRRRASRAASLKTIQLPEALTDSALGLEQALVALQQTPLPSDQRLRFSDVGQLAWAAQGVRVPRVTAGGTATPAEVPPMRVYFILPEGTYLYNPASHALEQTGDDDERQSLARALLNQPSAPAGGCQIIFAGSSRDFAARYGTQARNAMLLQAGQMAQSVQLQAVARGMTFVGIDNVNATNVRKAIRISRGLEPLYAMIVGYPAGQAPAAVAAEPVPVPTGKGALLVVPPQSFQDQELFETKRALELAGISASVASTRRGPLTGMLGGTINADLQLSQVNVSDYSAVVFIGGLGVIDYLNSSTVLNVARQALAQGKVVAAIGTAPAILANAGVLRSVQATAYISEQARLVQGGATYTGNPVERQGLIVTATGPFAVAPFVQAILDALAGG